ncbi:hypothetical protein F5148DRAFT_1170763 [Russula earlei]|uniref:Uncharacterized protein n=1 Tax=Russula earlei TaxID=71964 RepID=A0ACC0UK45_9AGAM|nr:hypothetical protein F5148DRAFT_1170763 [Russula earlei]
MATLKPDALEQIFLKLEEESERRALEAEQTALSPHIPDFAVVEQRAAQRRQSHRGSISVSRFGHVEEHPRPATSDPSQMPPDFVHGLTAISPFYRAQSYNHSADSLSDESSFGDDAGRSAESEHVTQVHRIAGRQSLPRSVGGMLHRTLTGSRSKNELSSSGVSTNLVIGVVVEEDHVEEPERLETRTTAYVQAPSTLRPHASRMTIPGAGRRDANGGWRSIAGDLFRRKARTGGARCGQ